MRFFRVRFLYFTFSLIQRIFESTFEREPCKRITEQFESASSVSELGNFIITL